MTTARTTSDATADAETSLSTDLAHSGPALAPKGYRTYGCDADGVPAYWTGGEPVWLWRKGKVCRYYTAAGEPVGPQHSNVAPAITYAAFNFWVAPGHAALSLACSLEARAGGCVADRHALKSDDAWYLQDAGGSAHEIR